MICIMIHKRKDAAINVPQSANNYTRYAHWQANLTADLQKLPRITYAGLRDISQIHN